ncbi:uncharacterized protein [Drosophila kikkawai]|uniref:Uncharacterized protein n=1 Tax=Drosophila kikkawai TaxID=30033 RepID=A0A6P4I2D3_DROKI|nr:uncharacterized protein LOC108075217 [Drosophila kikkawai]
MIAAVKLFWIVLVSVVLCAQGQPMYDGTKKPYPYASSWKNENNHFKDAKADLHSKGELIKTHKRSQGTDTGANLMDTYSQASNIGLPAVDQNMLNSGQMELNPSIAQGASLPITYSHQAPLYQEVNTPTERISDTVPNAYAEQDETEQRRQDLRNLVQHLYVAQARVQLEATEIRKAQAVASSAQAQLEESANQVRSVTASLHTAQQEVAASAIRAQIAQLQLAAHDQLLFAARQDVDALSSQMVGLQAAEGIVQPKLTVDLHALLDKLKQPLQQNDHPTPVPAIVESIPGMASHQQQQNQQWQTQGQGQFPGQNRLPDTSWNVASGIVPKGKRFSNLENYQK